jgi:K(+)-stimulated pyrophosphate-energized sodium pump
MSPKLMQRFLYLFIIFIYIKGYSVGSASLATFLLFRAFIDEVNFLSPVKKITVIDLTQPEIFVSGLIGACSVFVFSAWAMRAVGN